MESQRYQRVQNHPRFKELVEKRGSFAISLSLAMLVIYFGFLLLIAFAPGFLGTPIGNGVTTIGIPIGLGVIISAFVLTGIYVWKANTQFDALNEQIIRETT